MTVSTKWNQQRKGQWLFNKLSEHHNMGDFIDENCKGGAIHRASNLHLILFNITNEEFDKIMEEY